jgi:hypothetical protein
VAQSRYNNLGGDGVTNNVQILTVRAVPDGDEYDKALHWGYVMLLIMVPK